MGSQNPKTCGPPLLPHFHPLESPLQCPHHGAIQPFLPAVLPATPKLNTCAMFLRPDHRTMRGDLQKDPPPFIPLPGINPTPQETRKQASPQLPTSHYLAHCSQGPRLSPPLASWGRERGPPTLSSSPFNADTTLWLLPAWLLPAAVQLFPLSPARTLTGSSSRPGPGTCYSGWTPAGWRSGAARSQRSRPRRPRLRFLTPCCCSGC